jgi:hypothetical protein
MRKGLVAALGFLVVGARLVLADAQPAAAPSGPQSPVLVTNALEPSGPQPGGLVGNLLESNGCEPDCCFPAPECKLPCVWANTEYLLWWVRNASLPAPLVTAGSAADSNPGALGQPGTRLLFGNQDLDYGTFSGGRLMVGAWLNAKRTVGIEGGAFLLEQRSVGFLAGSDAAGSPLLAFPFTSPLTGGPDTLLISDPRVANLLTGGVAVSSATRLWGGEINGGVSVARKERFSLGILGGFRYLDLEEDLRIFNPTAIPNSNLVQLLTDQFDTRNQFYGGQLGGWVGVRQGRLSVDVTGKCALGSTHRVLGIAGQVVEVPTGGNPAVLPGGMYAQTTNIGRYEHDQFSVVPQAQVRVAFDLCRNLQVYAGYNFLYWTNVIRPGDQVDPVVNLSQSEAFGPGTLTGPPRPGVPFNKSDFWAHGVSFGIELRF